MSNATADIRYRKYIWGAVLADPRTLADTGRRSLSGDAAAEIELTYRGK